MANFLGFNTSIVDKKTGGIFTGDMFGLSYRELDVDGRQFIFPTTTPTQFEPDAMHASIDRLLSFNPPAMYLTHYGEVRDVPNKAATLKAHLNALVALAQAERNAGSERHQPLKTRLTD